MVFGSVDVSFGTPRLQRLCESAKELQRAHGDKCAAKVMARLADLRAAPSLEEFRRLPGRCHELDADREGQLALELSGRKRLVLIPEGNPTVRRNDGGLDWRSVEAIRVIEIVDYHKG